LRSELLGIVKDLKAHLTKKVPPPPKVAPPPLPQPIQKETPPPKAAEPEKKEAPPKLKSKTQVIDLQTNPEIKELDHTMWMNILKGIAPNLSLHATPPRDTKATQLKGAWKQRLLAPEIAILISPAQSPYKAFLQNLAMGVSIHGDCRLIMAPPLEQEEKWDNFLSADHLKLILCPDSLLGQLPKLKTHYSEKEGKTLGTKPVLLLPDLNLYLKDPLLKRSLWNVICAAL